MAYLFYSLLVFETILAFSLFLLARHSRKTRALSICGTLFTISIFALAIMAFAFGTEIRLFNLEHFKTKVDSIDSANALTVKFGIMKVRLELFGTVVPEDEESALKVERSLRSLIEGKKIKSDIRGEGKEQPIPVVVFLDDKNINETLIQEGLLLREGSPLEQQSGVGDRPYPEESSEAVQTEETKSRPLGVRLIIWGLLGLIGAALFGQVLNGKIIPAVFLLILGFFAVKNIISSIQQNGSFLPPALCLALILLFGGAFKKASQQAQEMLK